MDAIGSLIIARHIRRSRRQERHRIPRRFLRDSLNPLHIPDNLFIKNYRFPKDLFLWLCTEIRPYMTSPKRPTAIPLELKLLTTLSFLATGSYQTLVGNDWHSCQSQKGVSRSIDEVTASLQALMAKYIVFPRNGQELDQLKQGFYEDFRMPGVIGCIDGTHIAMVKPHQREELFFNRKGFHSINVTIICDSKGVLLGINARYGGAAHDAHVYKNMALYPYIVALRRTECFWILGDSAYPLSPWLMTPIPHVEPGSQEKKYNDRHGTARNTAERCIGVFKNRWRCTLDDRVLHYKPTKVIQIINACAVLHNIGKKANLCDEEYAPTIRDTSDDADFMWMGVNEDYRAGQTVRNALVQKIWNLRI